MMLARTNFLWSIDLISQVTSVVVSMTALMLLLPYLLSRRAELTTIAYGINCVLAIIMVINVLIIIGRWQRTQQRLGAISVYDSQALVHWHYDQKTWRAYADSERHHVFRLLARWLLPGLMMGSAVVYIWLQVFGEQIFWPLLIAVDVNLFVLLGKTLLLPYYRILNTRPEAIITPDGLYIGGVVHFWRQGNAMLRAVTLQQGLPHVLHFNLRVQNGRTTSTHHVHIPVPAGREAEAATVVAVLNPK